jgi:hypothetical protein
MPRCEVSRYGRAESDRVPDLGNAWAPSDQAPDKIVVAFSGRRLSDGRVVSVWEARSTGKVIGSGERIRPGADLTTDKAGWWGAMLSALVWLDGNGITPRFLLLVSDLDYGADLLNSSAQLPGPEAVARDSAARLLARLARRRYISVARPDEIGPILDRLDQLAAGA